VFESVLQCVAICCSVLQSVAVLSVKMHWSVPAYLRAAVCCIVLYCVEVCCIVLQCVAVCCSVLQRVVVCCSVLQRVVVCCSAIYEGAAA